MPFYYFRILSGDRTRQNCKIFNETYIFYRAGGFFNIITPAHSRSLTNLNEAKTQPPAATQPYPEWLVPVRIPDPYFEISFYFHQYPYPYLFSAFFTYPYLFHTLKPENNFPHTVPVLIFFENDSVPVHIPSSTYSEPVYRTRTRH